MASRIHRYLRMIFIVFTFGLAFRILISFHYDRSKPNLIVAPSNHRLRGVIVTLVRSTNQSIHLALNMIHSVHQFHSPSHGDHYPFLIFHDQNFTSSMRQQMLSCLLHNYKQINISFTLIDFRTSVQPAQGSRMEKTIGYRLMCRFWTYDVFYHPAVVQGQYDYLMRMDDDSYFFDTLNDDLFSFMDNQKLDYIYRTVYAEPIKPMQPILQRFLNSTPVNLFCIYNNFFVIRLKWFYESERVQSFVRQLIRDDLMLREYIGDGCAHAAMLEVDNQVNVKRVTTIPYGHNIHLMPPGYSYYRLVVVPEFADEMKKSCEQLTVIDGMRRQLKKIPISN